MVISAIVCFVDNVLEFDSPKWPSTLRFNAKLVCIVPGRREPCMMVVCSCFLNFSTNLKKSTQKIAARRAAFSENNAKLELFIVNFGFFTHPKQHFLIFRHFVFVFLG